MQHSLVLLRHGQSQWNLENRFTGWVDVDLSSNGIEEARQAGRTLRENGFEFDVALTSVLKRCIRTTWLVLEELDRMWLPVQKDWRLNERHYGALQGLNKKETSKKYGEKQVHLWRRGYSVKPPENAIGIVQDNVPQIPDLSEIPLSESLADTSVRVVQYWKEIVVPLLMEKQKILLVGHGNSLRALVKHLDNISDEKIMELNIPTGYPLVYQLDSELKSIEHNYLADDTHVNKAISDVKNQY